MTCPKSGMVRDVCQKNWPAMILAIGTATPPNYILQSDYPEYYFRVTNSEHKVELKEKFIRICEKSMIRKRHIHLTEEILNQNPSITNFNATSLNNRQDIAIQEVPKLAKQASLNAITEWNQPKSKITHLIFATTCSLDMPGADFHLLKLLNLQPSTKRLMLYQAGCHGGGTALRLAKDIAENNLNSRILVVCSEITTLIFHAPHESSIDSLIGQALFSDGAAALIIGADPNLSTERPLFEINSAFQTVIPNTDQSIVGRLRENGIVFHLSDQIPKLIVENIEQCLNEAFSEDGKVSDWNSLFWVVHSGGPAILDGIEKRLCLRSDKLEASRFVLREYGNVLSATVYFVLDEMRKRKVNDDGQREWGVLLGFGPGLTIETVVLRSCGLIV